MGTKQHAMHGRDHVEGGSDPIPGLTSSATAMWPMSHDLVTFTSIPENFDCSATAGLHLNQSTVDNTYEPYGWYFNQITTSTDSAEIKMYTRLGPQGSAWQFNYTAEKGPDCGRVSFAIQNVSEDTPGEGYELDGAGWIPGKLLRTVGTFYTINDGFSGLAYRDLYAAAQSKNNDPMSTFAFRILGEDGTVGTAVTSPGADGIPTFNGGAGLYCIKAFVNGKHASSSAYTVRFTGPIRAVRSTAEGYHTG